MLLQQLSPPARLAVIDHLIKFRVHILFLFIYIEFLSFLGIGFPVVDFSTLLSQTYPNQLHSIGTLVNLVYAGKEQQAVL